MSYELVPVTPQLLARLWANLWERGVVELERLGLSIHYGFYVFLDYASRASSSVALTCDGKPVFIAMAVKEGDEYFTAMQATKDFDRHVRPIIKTLRKRLGEFKEDPLYIYSVCVHHQTPRFFNALGFALDGAWQGETKTGHPIYRFARR